MTTEKDVKIHVKGLKKSFGHVHVLKGIDAEIKAGEVICVIGPSGSGKSTFLRCLNRLEEATAGEILVDGQSITEKSSNIDKIRQHIGMVFQQFNLFPHQFLCTLTRFLLHFLFYLFFLNITLFCQKSRQKSKLKLFHILKIIRHYTADQLLICLSKCIFRQVFKFYITFS